MTPNQIKLKNLCVQYAEDEWNSLSFLDCASKLDTASVRVEHKTKGATLTAIGEIGGFNAQAIVADTLLKVEENVIILPSEYAIFRAMIVDARARLREDTGLNLASVERQQLIDLVSTVGGWEQTMPGLTDIVKSLGISYEKPWKVAGYGQAPTALEIQAVFEASTLEQDWSGKQADIDRALAEGRGPLITTLRNIADELGV